MKYQSAITDPKANKERFDPSMNKNIQVDAKGMVNYQSLMEDGTKVELENLIKKWTVLQQEYEKLKENNKNLAGENGEITNEQIVQLEKQLKEEKDLVSKIQSSKEDLEKKIKELEEKYKDIEPKYIEGQSNTTSTVPTPPATWGTTTTWCSSTTRCTTTAWRSFTPRCATTSWSTTSSWCAGCTWSSYAYESKCSKTNKT